MEFEKEAAKGWYLHGYGREIAEGRKPSVSQTPILQLSTNRPEPEQRPSSITPRPLSAVPRPQEPLGQDQIRPPNPGKPPVSDKFRSIPGPPPSTSGRSDIPLPRPRGRGITGSVRSGYQQRQGQVRLPSSRGRGIPAAPRSIPPRDRPPRNPSIAEGPAPITTRRPLPWVVERRKELQNRQIQAKLMFYWPRDGPSLKTCFGEDLEDLDYLRQEYRIHVYMQSELPNYICLASETAFDTAEITQKLRELWKQKVARLEFRIKAYMMEPPERNPKADQVAITKQDGAALANLHLTQAREFKSKLGALAKGMSCLPQSNHKRVRDGLNACMSMIKHLNTEMRLRIKFGSFVHDRWKGGGGTDAIYPLNEFPGLLSDDRWQGRLVPGFNLSQERLLARFMKLKDFLELRGAITDISALAKVKAQYSATFELARPETSMNNIRLDVNFEESPGAIESGSVTYNWFRTTPRSIQQPPMQLSMIDFDRADWQIELQLIEPMSEDDITDAQRNFAQSVKIEPFFRTAPITAKPGRKIYFPPDVAVSKYVTKSSIQFRVKDTDYVLELAKFEEFRCSITAGYVRWTPPRVRWGAFLMNPKWERILGNRNNRPKHLGIDSLFPPGPLKGQNHNDSDFEVLLQVIKRVAELLSPLPQTGERAPSDDEEAEAAGVLDSGLGTLF